MNTEPPTGDDLQQMLVSMKREVLTRADQQRPAPRRRGRRAGIVIGVIAVLGIGATSGGVALGMIPQPFAAAPAPSPSATTVDPSETPTPSSAPVVSEPTSTPTPTSTRKPFAAEDPATWTISGSEFGPIALGGEAAAETDVFDRGYMPLSVSDECPTPGYAGWVLEGDVSVEVFASDNGSVYMVRLFSTDPFVTADPAGSAPTTAEGIGLGSTLDELRTAYPGVRGPADALASPFWTVDTSSGPITFEVAEQDGIVRGVHIGDRAQLPSSPCD